ncbi:phosphate acetyltransferase [Rhodoferax antarcticus]|uniref:Phosphate acetyltransferase n=1 Tax=Rhodoferax antarcticus ANT.BR TaxID=1111071 RepID=A0A1Q8Y9N2_9BURK|nr:phosphate acetyltransferase [Rhodoferax antarcticus]APW48447.1 phosphate acetyltransferase [Rhodoferax antarcticus]MCW2312151.1 phosphate acetyltransferase [Rhodoferax antarcticus]OLP04679.1 phosphate acetyltransferase [Rhodoferax antarcticus ANT.BR]
MRTYFLTATEPNVGLTSVSLGLLRALQRRGLKVAFFKPVTKHTPQEEASVWFARTICQVESTPDPLPMSWVTQQVTSGKTDEVLEDIVSLAMSSVSGADVLVVEGIHADPNRAFIPQLSVEISRSLQADVILVGSGADAQGIAQTQYLIARVRNSGRHVKGVIFNRVTASFDEAAVANQLHGVPIFGVVRENPMLSAPRTLDMVRHLGAEVMIEGELATRRVRETVLCGRSVAEVIPRLKPGALVISAGDRDDVMLATALAASNGIELAGLVLTHHSYISPRILRFGAKAFQSGLPVLRTDGDSYETANRISRLPLAVPPDDLLRMNQVIDSVVEQLDASAICAGLDHVASRRMSPPAFRYQLMQKARAANKRIVLPEGDEPRTIRAAVTCTEKGLARCVLLGKRRAIQAAAEAMGVELPEALEILDPAEIAARFVAPMVALRQAKGLTPGQALLQLEDTVVLGTMMLAVGEVDGLVSGAVHTTANTVRPALQLIKTAPGSSIVSSCFFMLMPEQVLVYADCAVNPDPSAEELADIAKQSADSARAFGIDPKVAMISYSTGVSGAGEDVEKVRAATELAKARWPDLVIDGPMQYDAATVQEVGAQKAPGSAVAGQATVLIFPDLNTGNTTYKAVQRSANVLSVGPMLQGLRKPVNDLSRGALVDDIVFTIALTAIQAEAMSKA